MYVCMYVCMCVCMCVCACVCVCVWRGGGGNLAVYVELLIVLHAFPSFLVTEYE